MTGRGTEPETPTPPIAWSVRVRVFLQRFWQPAGACMTCMPGSLGNVWSLAHWLTALQTGFATAVLAVLLTFTPLRRLYLNAWGNALVVGVLTAVADAWSHPSHYGFPYAESLLTGMVSAALALVGWYLLEDRARRLRALWSRVTGRPRS